MRNSSTALFTAACAALALAGCAGPRELAIEAPKNESRPFGYPVDTYVGEVPETHREIAVIESKAYQNDSAEARQRQLEDLRERARELGADAVQGVRLLTKRVRGYSADERTPFLSFRQGEYPLYFLRGEAIVYEAGLPGAISSGGGFTSEPAGYQPSEAAESPGEFIFRTPAEQTGGSRPGPLFGVPMMR